MSAAGVAAADLVAPDPAAGCGAPVLLDGLALLPTRDGGVALANESARLVLDRLRDGAGVAGAATAIAERFGIPRRRAAADALAAAGELRRLRLWPASPATVRRSAADTAETATPLAPPAWHFDELLAPLGRPVRVRIGPPRLARLVTAMLGAAGPSPSARSPTTAVGPAVAKAPASTITAVRRRSGHELRLDDRRVLAGADLALARSELVRHLLLASGAGRRWLAVLHAAAVSDGRAAVLLCGASGSGKSTLTARLVASGLALVTDDYAPLEAGTRGLWPTPFGMSVKAGSWPLLDPLLPGLAACPPVSTRGRVQRYLPPPRREQEPRRVAALVFPAYVPGRPCRAEPLRPREALALIVHAGGWFESTPERLRELAAWVESTPAVALTYGDGAEAVAAVWRLLVTGRDRPGRASPR